MRSFMLRAFSKKQTLILILPLFVLFIWTAGSAAGTSVRMVTNMGNIDVELFDDVTPVTVANFIKYITDGDYENTFIHRSVPDFVIQGGGYRIEGSSVVSVPTDPPIVNEFSVSNTRGTIAMAKLAGDPNSATSQWFFNLADNSSHLDNLDGGFTVFGRTTGAGLDVMDAIASLPVYNASSALGAPFETLPLLDNALTAENLVTVSSMIVTYGPGAGDVDNNGQIDISDVILSLQAAAGKDTSSGISSDADVNADAAVGLAEAAYGLQIVAGVRSE
jgi:cyclophilin family peptidyl-prolyl cis-trans isomerase